MSSRRTAILIVAIVVGVIAVLLIVRYVQGIEDDYAQKNELQDVFVVKDQIARASDGGQAVQEGKIVGARLPRQFVPSTAISSTDAVQKKVAAFPLAPGTVIVDGMFVEPGQAVLSFRDRIKNKNWVAVSFQVDQVRGVGGFLVPGDRINIMMFADQAAVRAALEGGAAAGAGRTDIPNLPLQPPAAEAYVNVGGEQWMLLDPTARYLYQDVQILAIGSNVLLGAGETAASASGGTATGSTASAGTPQQSNPGIITVQVPPEAAQWIVTASVSSRGLYLSLVPNNYKPRPLPPLPVIVNKLPGEDAALLTPYKYQEPQG